MAQYRTQYVTHFAITMGAATVKACDVPGKLTETHRFLPAYWRQLSKKCRRYPHRNSLSSFCIALACIIRAQSVHTARELDQRCSRQH